MYVCVSGLYEDISQSPNIAHQFFFENTLVYLCIYVCVYVLYVCIICMQFIQSTFSYICRDTWYSSPLYATGLAINDIVHSAILYSGLNLKQFIRFCQFIGTTHTSPSSYYRFQRLYAAPTVNQEYKTMEAEQIEKYKTSTGVILSGDCRMDSPGFSAVKGTYSLMDHDTGVILAMEHGDKRQVRYGLCFDVFIYIQ